MVTTHELTGHWQVRMIRPGAGAPAGLLGVPMTALVPGSVHLDLLNAGVIPDPYLDDNEERLHWIGASTWRYDRTVEVDADLGDDRADLVCEGLDTVAEIQVNGTTVARTRNMHRTYRFRVGHMLRRGANSISVIFHPADEDAARLRDLIGDLPRSYTHSYNFVRKMACNFGWDWGPDLTTAGIWRRISIQRWQRARMGSVRPLVTVDGDTGTVRFVVDLERDRPSSVSLVASVGHRHGVTVVDAGATRAEVVVTVPEVRRWWPYGRGEQSRYDARLVLVDDDHLLDAWSGKVGFRSVNLDTGLDEYGRRFAVEVNGEPTFVRGVNWIPDDCFPSRVTRADLSTRLRQARDAGVNLIRVWGGGVFESDDFYQLCDEMGLLVWQDLLFACAAYPEESPLREEIEAEVTDAVDRLVAHPSLILWNGCNENIWAHQDWGWGPGTEGRTWGLGYYLDILPDLISRRDPTRPYWPGSPFSGGGVHPNDPAYGTTHLWDVWNHLDYRHYRDTVPRFAGEFGFQGPAAYATMRRAVTDDPLTPRSAGVLAHQKAEDGSGKIDRGLAAHFGVPADFDDWHFLASVNQARAVETGITHFRSHVPVCMGTVLWQLNDCWPVTSWSVVDGDGRLKPAWYALRRAYEPCLLTLQPRDDRLAVVIVNDQQRTWAGTATVTRRRVRDGVELASFQTVMTAGPGSKADIVLPPEIGVPDHAAGEMVVAEAAGCRRAFWFFRPDHAIDYPRAAHRSAVVPAEDGYLVVVRAGTLLRDVTLFPDRLDPGASVDDNGVTLLPGESFTFAVRCRALADPGLLATAPVLRSVNDGAMPGSGSG